jgi:hypothetical protein
MFCRSLFVLLYFFFWPFFFDKRILITPLVSSSSSYSLWFDPTWTRLCKVPYCGVNNTNHYITDTGLTYCYRCIKPQMGGRFIIALMMLSLMILTLTYYWHITCFRHDIAEYFLITHSLTPFSWQEDLEYILTM